MGNSGKKEQNKGNLKSLEIPQLLTDYGLNYHRSDLLLIYEDVQNVPAVYREFRSTHFSVILVRRGVLKIKVNLLDYSVGTHELIVIPANAIRQFQFTDHVAYYAMLFSADFLFRCGLFQKHFKFFSFIEGFRSFLTLEEGQASDLSKLMDVLKTKLRSNISSETDHQITEMIFQAIMLEVLNRWEKNPRHPLVGGNELTYRFLTLLPQHFREERTVGFYAQKLSVNPKYITQVLTARTGRSARDFIVEMVIMEAKLLLDDPRRSISAIAEYLHFSDQFHFSHFFKKHTHQTPSKYRNKTNL